MKHKFTIIGIIAVVLIIGTFGPIFGQEKEQKPLPTENFYNKSLHYTNKGIAYMYSKESGGLETITGVPGADIGCDKPECHVRSCDACHALEADGKMTYSLDPAKSQEVCARCHPVEKDDPDVHFSRGMKCMDCHNAQEIHGDGTEYIDVVATARAQRFVSARSPPRSRRAAGARCEWLPTSPTDLPRPPPRRVPRGARADRHPDLCRGGHDAGADDRDGGDRDGNASWTRI